MDTATQRPRRRARLRGGAFAALAIVLLIACTEQACRLIGAPPTVSVDTSAVVGGQKGLLSVRFCVNLECRNYHRTPDRLQALQLSDSSANDEGPVHVTLDIVNENGAGDIVFTGRASVLLTMSQPNGPDCEPTAWATSLVANEDSRLTPA